MDIFRRREAAWTGGVVQQQAEDAGRVSEEQRQQSACLLPLTGDSYAAVNDAETAAAAKSAAAAAPLAVQRGIKGGVSNTATTAGQEAGAAAVARQPAASAAEARGAALEWGRGGGAAATAAGCRLDCEAAATASSFVKTRGAAAVHGCAGALQQRGIRTAAATAHAGAPHRAAEASPRWRPRFSVLWGGRRTAAGRGEQARGAALAEAAAGWRWREGHTHPQQQQQQQQHPGTHAEEQRQQQPEGEMRKCPAAAADGSAAGSSWCTPDVAQEAADSDSSLLLLVDDEQDDSEQAEAATGTARAAAKAAAATAATGHAGREGGAAGDGPRLAELSLPLEQTGAAADIKAAAAGPKGAAATEAATAAQLRGAAAGGEARTVGGRPTKETAAAVSMQAAAGMAAELEKATAAGAQQREAAAAGGGGSEEEGIATKKDAGTHSPSWCLRCRGEAEDNDLSPAAASLRRSFFDSFFFEEKKFTFFNKKRLPGWRGGGAVTEQDIHQDFESLTQDRGSVLSRARKHARSKWKKFSFWRVFLSFFPIVRVLQTYDRSFIMADFFAGVSEGVMAVPMGMSYAMLANLPPQFGLYVGLFYPLVYMCVGSSALVNVGVSAIEDLLVGEAVSRVIHEKDWVLQLVAKEEQLQQLQQQGAADSGRWPEPQWQLLQQNVQLEKDLLEKMRLDVSVGLCVCIGIIYLLLRLLSAHMLADLLSVPVLSGFSTASAFLIGTSQLKHFLGLSLPPQVENADFKLPRQWWFFLTHLSEANWVAVVMCITCLWTLGLCKYLSKKYCKKFPPPGPLIIVILFTLVNYLARLDERAGLRVIGSIPRGFPSPSLPSFSIPVIAYDDHQQPHITYRVAFLDMLRESLALTAMFFIIHISIAKTLAQQKRSYQLLPEQELVALACCNFFGSFFQCFPCATSLSRSSVAATAGARTQLHALSNVLLVVLTLSLITPLLYYLPTAVLAAVVLFGVYGMMDFRELLRLCKIGGPDLLLWLACFLTTIIFGAVEGIVASIVLSLLWLLRKTARPPCITLGRLPNTRIYRNISRFPMAAEHPGIKIVRFDASLNFSNSDFFESRMRQKLLPGTRVLIVDGSSINDLDITAVRMLQRFCRYLQQRDTLLLFANWKGPMRDFLERAAFYQTLPPQLCFLSLQDAVYFAQAYIHHKCRPHHTQLEQIKDMQKQTQLTEKSAVRRYCKRTHNPAAPLEPFYWQQHDQKQQQQQQQQQRGEREEAPERPQQLQQQHQEPQQQQQQQQQHTKQADQQQHTEDEQQQLEEKMLKLPLLQEKKQAGSPEAGEDFEGQRGYSYMRYRLSASTEEESEHTAAAGLLFAAARKKRWSGSGREDEEEEEERERGKALRAAASAAERKKRSPLHASEEAAGAGDSSLSTASPLSLCTSDRRGGHSTSSSSKKLHIPLRYYCVSANTSEGSASELCCKEGEGGGAREGRTAAAGAEEKTPVPASILHMKPRGAAARGGVGAVAAAFTTASSSGAVSKNSAAHGSCLRPSAAAAQQRRRRSVLRDEAVLEEKEALRIRRMAEFWSAGDIRDNTTVCLRSRSMTSLAGHASSRGLPRRHSTCSTAWMTVNEESEGQGGGRRGLQQRGGSLSLNRENTLWALRGLSSADPPMVELVTEVTGGGGCKQWAVLRTDEMTDSPGAHPHEQDTE